MIGLQTPQTVFAGLADVIGRQTSAVGAGNHRLVHLGGKHDFVALAACLEPIADDFFGHFGISPEEAIAAIADESDYDIPEADFDRLAYPAAFIISVIEYTEDYSLLLPAFRAEVYQDGIPVDADIAASLGIYLSLAEGYI